MIPCSLGMSTLHHSGSVHLMAAGCWPAAVLAACVFPVVQQLAGRIERAHRNTEKSEEVDTLEAENRAMRKLLVCSVCDQRQKNVVITKCYHMFCNVCTDSALAARNRQCPSCGHKYNMTDVKPFYFT